MNKGIKIAFFIALAILVVYLIYKFTNKENETNEVPVEPTEPRKNINDTVKLADSGNVTLARDWNAKPVITKAGRTVTN